MANAIGPSRFAYQHKAWFPLCERRGATGAFAAHIQREYCALAPRCNRTMERVYTYLGLPSLPDNRNISAVPTEWPCDIQNDPSVHSKSMKRRARMNSLGEQLK